MSINIAQIEELFVAQRELKVVKAKIKANDVMVALQKELKIAEQRAKAVKNVIISQKDNINSSVRKYVTLVFTPVPVDGYEYTKLECHPNEQKVIKSGEADEKRYLRLVALYKGELIDKKGKNTTPAENEVKPPVVAPTAGPTTF